MSCGIHMNLEVFNEETSKWEEFTKDIFELDEFDKKYYKKEFNNIPFDHQSYSWFGFLANVRNYSKSESLSDCRGIPLTSCFNESYHEDLFSEPNHYGNYELYSRFDDQHSITWLTLDELLNFNYDKKFIDVRDEPVEISYRDFLGHWFFKDLEALKTIKAKPYNIRLVFGFDS